MVFLVIHNVTISIGDVSGGFPNVETSTFRGTVQGLGAVWAVNYYTIGSYLNDSLWERGQLYIGENNGEGTCRYLYRCR
jgi:hypothetical protein